MAKISVFENLSIPVQKYIGLFLKQNLELEFSTAKVEVTKSSIGF